MGSADTVTGPINIGNPTEFTILQLASQVIELVGSRSRIVHRALPQDDPRQRQPDISRAHEALSWLPRTPLNEGLKRTITYFNELLRDQSLRAQCQHRTGLILSTDGAVQAFRPGRTSQHGAPRPAGRIRNRSKAAGPPWHRFLFPAKKYTF